MTVAADDPKWQKLPKLVLLTDQQVADRHGWKAGKVRRLRLSGKIPFFPGRPPLIEEVDLDAYLAAVDRHREPPPPPTPEEQREIERREIGQLLRRKWVQVNSKAILEGRVSALREQSEVRTNLSKRVGRRKWPSKLR